MRLDERFEFALSSSDPVAQLRSLAQSLISQGESHDAVLSCFETARNQLRSEDREADEDAVADVIDFLIGWCRPEMAISAETLNPSHGSSQNGDAGSVHDLKHAD